MATLFEVKLDTRAEIVDFHVILPDGSHYAHSSSKTGNLAIQKGWLGGTTLRARLRDGLAAVRMVAVLADGRRADLSSIAPFGHRTIQI